MPETPNKITLGAAPATAREFFVRGPVIEAPISDFAAQVRLGEPSYEARQGAGYIVIETLHGGPGVLEGNVREDAGRYAWNTGLDTRIPDQVTRPPRSAEDVGAAHGVGALRGWNRGLHFTSGPGDTMAVKGGAGLFVLNPVTASSWVDQSPSANAVFIPTTVIPGEGVFAASPLLVVSDGADVFFTIGDFSWASLTLPAGASARSVLGISDTLLVHLDDRRVIYYTSPPDFVVDSGAVNADVLWRLPPGEFMGAFRSPWGNAAPYFITDGSGDIYVCHVEARVFEKVPLPIGGVTSWAPFEDGFVVSNGVQIIQIIVNAGQFLIREMPVFPGQGAPPGENWRVSGLVASLDGHMYAQLSKGTQGWIWEWNGSAWHPFGIAQTVGAASGIVVTDKSASAPGADAQTLAWQFGDTSAFRVKGPSNSRNPLADSAMEYETAGGDYAETPWMDMGFRELLGAMFEVWHGSTTVDGTNTVSVEYALDGSTIFIPLGTFDGTQNPIRLRFSTPDASGAIPGTEFRRIKFRFIPIGGSASPNCLPMTLVFRKKPLLRMGFSFTIDIAHMQSHPDGVAGWDATITVEDVADYLRDLFNTKPQLYFSAADRTTTRAGIATYNIMLQEIRSGQRVSPRCTMQLEEIVDGA